MSSWRQHPLHSKLNCHFTDVGACSERRIKDLASKSCYKTLCHAGLFCGASGRREKRGKKSASSLKTRPKWNLRQQGFPFWKWVDRAPLPNVRAAYLFLHFKGVGVEWWCSPLHPPTKQTLSEWEAYECEDAPRDCDKSAHNSETNRCHSRDAC